MIQVATDGYLAVIDPQKLSNIDLFWNMLVDGDHQTVVHAGREELLFCHRATDKVPEHWFDVQVAAGMVGMEYPASYGKLIQRQLGHSLNKGETRTDWRRRPLTNAQIEYALQDVVHLLELRDTFRERLDELGRMSWLESEAKSWQYDLLQAQGKSRWRRVSGSANLPPRALAIECCGMT